jgi:(+)-neomenthol dehydrogenase
MQHFRNEEMKQELNDVGNLTEERLDELLDTFLKGFEAGKVDTRGWPFAFAAYKVAKAAMNAYSRILAAKQPALRVNCVHPGYIKTDITMHSGLLTPEEGASRVVKVAMLPEGGVTGAFFDEGEEASFV